MKLVMAIESQTPVADAGVSRPLVPYAAVADAHAVRVIDDVPQQLTECGRPYSEVNVNRPWHAILGSPRGSRLYLGQVNVCPHCERLTA
jgi:hypothetical protein